MLFTQRRCLIMARRTTVSTVVAAIFRKLFERRRHAPRRSKEFYEPKRAADPTKRAAEDMYRGTWNHWRP
jgi:hypothetical protein